MFIDNIFLFDLIVILSFNALYFVYHKGRVLRASGIPQQIGLHNKFSCKYAIEVLPSGCSGFLFNYEL